jgi:hypothetical protein
MDVVEAADEMRFLTFDRRPPDSDGVLLAGCESEWPMEKRLDSLCDFFLSAMVVGVFWTGVERSGRPQRRAGGSEGRSVGGPEGQRVRGGLAIRPVCSVSSRARRAAGQTSEGAGCQWGRRGQDDRTTRGTRGEQAREEEKKLLEASRTRELYLMAAWSQDWAAVSQAERRMSRHRPRT